MIQIREKITEMTQNLLEMAQDLSISKVSDNVMFYIKEIKREEINGLNFGKKLFSHNYENNLIDIENLIVRVEKDYEKILWVNLVFYKSEIYRSIVLVEFLLKNKKEILDKYETNFHAEIKLPMFYQGGKFDLNWHIL